MKNPLSSKHILYRILLTVFSLSVLPFSFKVVAQGKKGEWLEKNKPTWVWTQRASDGQKLFLRKSFDIPANAKSARVYATCDNKLQLWINGKEVGTSPDWAQPIEKDVTALLKPGKNVIAAQAENAGGTAAFVLKLEVKLADGKTVTVLSDDKWKAAAKESKAWFTEKFDDQGWDLRLVTMGELGVGPWGVPAYKASKGSAKPKGALPAESLTLLPGFKAELLYTVPKEEEGSWVVLAKDDKGRFYACDQKDKGLYRITVTESAGGPKTTVEKVPVDLSGAMGLKWAFGGLYVHVSGKGLFKLTDSNGDDKLDKVDHQPSAQGGGEHGNHAIEVTEDGKALYVIAGNHTNLMENYTSRVQSWDEDLLLPRQWDARGHARGRKAPGGWVTRYDPEKRTYEVYTIGFRNEYDIAMNRHGDLFTYDADMEWDMGMPWYRPTRINQVVSGADYGWRSGSGKWPNYYEDSLPPVVEIGPGSPTGFVAGTGAKFPEKYQDALFGLDWTFGTIYAVHLKAEGAGYTGSKEVFVAGAPLPVTDAVIGDDGAMYFTIGGRGAQSALYRVTYSGDEPTLASQSTPDAHTSLAQTLRRNLEGYHGKKVGYAVDEAWPHLGSKDRFIRNAARVAVESQDVAQWRGKVLSVKDPQTKITGAVALARSGEAADKSPLL
ncbi:MAG: cytochrome C, partial [Verrucomicrobia bacterium]|nr:cytochrome C [Verrucomicrobiota bacterium]